MNNAMSTERKVQLPMWAKPFCQPARYKTAYGGRASSKTWTFAHLMVADAARQNIRIACCRQHQNSIRESVKTTIEIAIRRLGLQDFFDIQQHVINGANGSHFFFTGLEEKRESIRGWESVNRVWVEEAQNMTPETAEILIPTLRTAGCEIWLTWNPKNRTDWVWDRFIVHPRQDDVIAKVNWRDNPWFPEESEIERRACEIETPELYAHIWEGEPDDGGGDRKILTYDILRNCIDAYRRGLHKQASGQLVLDAGLDIADGGGDSNALVIRRGPIIESAESWHPAESGFLTPTAKRAHRKCDEEGVYRIYYDTSGVGSPIRGEFARIPTKSYALRAVNFGGKVGGANKTFSRGIKNEDMFARRNGQLGWALRLRAMRTVRLLKGENVDPTECLFISDKIPRIEQYIAQLSQPVWRDNPTTGKTEIDKRGKEGEEKSPDLYDATALAFARDSDNGIRAR